jgi:hypothetical protein
MGVTRDAAPGTLPFASLRVAGRTKASIPTQAPLLQRDELIDQVGVIFLLDAVDLLVVLVHL